MNFAKTTALLLGATLAVACGGDDAPGDVDAAGPDADTTPDAPVAGTVTLEVDVEAANIPPGTRILFLDPDDSVVSDVAAAPGNHSAELFPGGSIVVVVPELLNAGGAPQEQQQLAILNLLPGRTYRITGGDNTAAVNNRTITAPTVAGATSYTFSTPCANSSSGVPTTTLDLGRCGATTDVFVAAFGAPLATGGGGGALLKTVIKRGVSTGADINLAAEPTTNPVAFSLAATGIRASAANAFVGGQLVGDGANWALPPPVFQSDAAPFPGGMLSVEGLLPSAAGSKLSLFAAMVRSTGGQINYQQVVDPAASVTMDLGALDAAWLDAIVPDVKSSSLRFISSGGGDFGLAAGSLEVARYAAAATGGPLATASSWEFVSLLGPDQVVRIPTLPAAYAIANLTADLGANGYVAGDMGGYVTDGSYEGAMEGWFGDAGGPGAFGTALVATSYAGFGNL
ncbi:MAG: hypothetical protein R2939_17565 [Kofleriaceae bacterium]